MYRALYWAISMNFNFNFNVVMASLRAGAIFHAGGDEKLIFNE